ncbi:IS110 family transposase, partial [Anaerocolumna jejuensis]|uniref:IS110 family transposase n=1 Tax=Anaerocolumna jejuensis TaxID=259063 RepID=UPI003F7C9DF5
MDFEVVHLICAGLDVHKKSVVAAVCTTDPVTLEAKYNVKSFSTNNSDIIALREWLLAQNCHNVCMESTGKYWIPIFNILETHMRVILTHPKYVKAIKGKKTDKRDAKWIANLFRFDIVKASFIPPSDIRALRELSRYRLKLSYMRTAEKNRYQNSMTISRIRIDCVLTDPFGKTATNIMNYLLSDKPFEEAECSSLIDRRVKASHEAILDSIRGFEILSEQKFKMTHAKKHMDFLNSSIVELEAELFRLSRPYDQLIKMISKMTGYTELSALFVISEIGTDMSVFESDKHLCSWAGLTPANNESANKKKSIRCSKAGQYLKPLLVQCALAAVKSKKDPYYAIKYQRLAKRRGKKKAIIAIARMMLTSIYHMIQGNEEFHPDDYEAVVRPSKPVKVTLTFDNVLQFLREQGAETETLKLLQQQCAAKT